jgi:hypothetical protein
MKDGENDSFILCVGHSSPEQFKYTCLVTNSFMDDMTDRLGIETSLAS